MADSANRYDYFAKKSVVPVSRIRYYPIATPAVIQEINCGIFFIVAWWSGKSLTAFRTLTEVLAAVDREGRLEFVVADTDGCPEIYESPEFVGKIHGYGETAWVNQGQIVCMSGLGYHPECFDANTRALLERCQA